MANEEHPLTNSGADFPFLPNRPHPQQPLLSPAFQHLCGVAGDEFQPPLAPPSHELLPPRPSVTVNPAPDVRALPLHAQQQARARGRC